MLVLNCEQGSEKWALARAGIPTASEFSCLLAKGRGGKESKARRTYLLKLAGERLTGVPMENYTNAHMERGRVMEAEARDLYAFLTDTDPDQVGFIRRGDTGCSPDGLLGTKGAIEIKTKMAHLHLDCLLRDEFPEEHKAQCQGILWITERDWIDLVIYWPNLPLIVKRAWRDEPYIEELASAVGRFNEELLEVVEKVEKYRRDHGPTAAILEAIEAVS
ncbi:lambda exonuclease family protein [Methyloligella solikamskensis]|uniref:Lambda exonuclease family protein n=1 Tax=Methyloligella solikamskensis TaxID=1177756 RepID=A0ABW3JB92_9HYPH